MYLNPTDDNNEDEEEEDIHDTDCYICQEGGDLICCDGCTKVYHSNCHTPKIKALPEGEWYCMECPHLRPKKAKKVKEKKQKYTGPLIAALGDRKVTCTVRFPMVECIVCEEFEGEQNYFDRCLFFYIHIFDSIPLNDGKNIYFYLHSHWRFPAS